MSQRRDGWQDSIAGLSVGEPELAAPVEQGSDRYDREALLAVGGMGRVYLARDRRLDRPVALKEALDSPEASHALLHEAQVLAALDHPGIVPVHDVGHTDDGRPFCATRLVRGRTLATVVHEQRDLRERLQLLTHFRDACQAVAYAHDQGMLHRDLKPANLIVGQFGETQVIDWGLAVAVDRAGPGVLGSPAWMAPEATRGAPADRRTDVWGLGAVLYYLLTGQSPRAAEPSTLSADDAVPVRFPPVSELEPEAPPELCAIVSRALATAPDDRYPHAQALAEDVERYLTGARVHAHHYSRAELLSRFVRAWRAPLLVAALAGFALGTLALSSARRLADERDRAVVAESDAEHALLTALVAQARQSGSLGATGVAGVIGASALALDEHPAARGALVAALSQWPATRVHQAPVHDCTNAVLIPDGLLCRDARAVWLQRDGVEQWRAPVASVSLHPSGDTLAAHRARDVVWLDLRTGAQLGVFPRRSPLPLLGTSDGRYATRRWEGESWMGGLAPAERVLINGCAAHGLPRDAALHPTERRHAAWCADGTVALTMPEGAKLLSTGLSVEEHGDASSLAWSLDARHLAIGHLRGRLAWLSVADGRVQVAPSSRTSAIAQVVINPTGDLLATRLEIGEVEVWSTDPLAHVVSLPMVGVTDLHWRDDDELRVLGSTDTTWKITPQPVRPLLREGLGLSGVLFTPDGRSLITTHSDGLVVAHPIAPGGAAFRTVIGPGVVMSAAFDPDRRSLVLAPGEMQHPVRLNLSGEALPALDVRASSRAVLPRPNGRIIGLTFSDGGVRIDPDGTVGPLGCGEKEWRSWSGTDDGLLHLLVAVDGEVMRLRDGQCSGAVPGLLATTVALSPDGAWLVAATAEGLVRSSLDGEIHWTVPFSPRAAVDLTISPDRTWIAAAGLDQTARLLRADDGELRAELRGHGSRVSSVAFSPDGAWLATGSWDGTARLWRTDVATAPAAELHARVTALGWPGVEAVLGEGG